MPYWSGGMNWLSGQYHQNWDTSRKADGTLRPDGKYLLILELFGPGGARIKPNGAAGPGTDRPFQFRRWEAPGDTDNVPFADCAHVFWIDNTKVVGDIFDLRRNGVANTQECQFISGPAASTMFSAGFTAYHSHGVTTGGGPGDTNSFMQRYTLTWQRGLNGPSGTIETGTADQGELAVEEFERPQPRLPAWPPPPAAGGSCPSRPHRLHLLDPPPRCRQAPQRSVVHHWLRLPRDRLLRAPADGAVAAARVPTRPRDPGAAFRAAPGPWPGRVRRRHAAPPRSPRPRPARSRAAARTARSR